MVSKTGFGDHIAASRLPIEIEGIDALDLGAGIDKPDVKLKGKGPFTSFVQAADTESKIKTGEPKLFSYPIGKQDGVAWLKQGEIADDDAILGVTIFVDGVGAKIPK